MRISPISAALALVLLAACTTAAPGPSGDTPSRGGPGSSSAPTTPAADATLIIDRLASAGGPGISVGEALANTSDQGLLINGALFIDPDGNVLLCEAIAESFPPQCGGRRLAVEGLDPDSIPDIQEEGSVRWAEAVQLFGTIEH